MQARHNVAMLPKPKEPPMLLNLAFLMPSGDVSIIVASNLTQPDLVLVQTVSFCNKQEPKTPCRGDNQTTGLNSQAIRDTPNNTFERTNKTGYQAEGAFS